MITCILIHLLVTKIAYSIFGNTYTAFFAQWFLTLSLGYCYLNFKTKLKERGLKNGRSSIKR